MTMGTLLFYGGIGLFGVVLAAMIITNVILSAKEKKLRKMLHDRYEMS